MASSGAHGGYTMMRDPKWSRAEKAVARKAFDQALQRELEAVLQEAKTMAAKIAPRHESNTDSAR
ncbi:MAG: hypothetical protein LAN64_05900 [Acidobacteriia bacterium]|nr:hypothetical protein [Terriglobia bacterium]